VHPIEAFLDMRDVIKRSRLPAPNNAERNEPRIGADTETDPTSELVVSSKLAKPRVIHYVMLLLYLMFVSISICMMLVDGVSFFSIGSLGFWGLALCAVVGEIARQRGYRAFRATKVTVIGGVVIRARRTRFLALGGVLIVIGTSLLISFEPIVGKGAALCIALLGAALVFVTITGVWWPWPSFLQFVPDGLRIGHRGWSALIPWEGIYRVHAMEQGRLPFVCLSLLSPEVVHVWPASARTKVLKKLRGAVATSDVSIPTFVFGIDLPVLMAAIRRYRGDPAARSELAQRALDSKASE
jgi:hypothetical protein